MDTDSQIRTALKAEMIRRGWSQQQLADQLGISKSAMAQILSGKYGKIPQSLIDVLNALDLELTVQSKPNEHN